MKQTPAVEASAIYGWSYRSVDHIRTAGSVMMLALPAVRITVSDLFP